MLAAPVAPTTSILPYYDEVGASLGAELIAPRKLLHNVVEDLLMEGRGAAARDAYETLVLGYGAPSDASELVAEIKDVERRPPPKETVEGLLATPFPEPEEAQRFLGEWVGDIWMNDDEPKDESTHLFLEVVDGKLAGKTVNRFPNGEELVMPWTYLEITPQGMSWGFMNGMRPRGMLLYEAKLEGDRLTGKNRFGGIDFHRPDGSSPPELSFSFRRVKG